MSLCSDVDFVFYIYYHFFSLDRDSTCSGSASSSPTSPYRGHCATSSPTPPIWWDGGSSTSFRTTTRGQQNGGMFVTYKLQRSLFSILHFGIAQNQLVYPPPPPSLPKCCFQCLLGLGVTAVSREIEGNNSNPTSCAVFAPQSLHKLLFCKCFFFCGGRGWVCGGGGDRVY